VTLIAVPTCSGSYAALEPIPLWVQSTKCKTNGTAEWSNHDEQSLLRVLARWGALAAARPTNAKTAGDTHSVKQCDLGYITLLEKGP
jgi:hypothetical protein